MFLLFHQTVYSDFFCRVPKHKAPVSSHKIFVWFTGSIPHQNFSIFHQKPCCQIRYCHFQPSKFALLAHLLYEYLSFPVFRNSLREFVSEGVWFLERFDREAITFFICTNIFTSVEKVFVFSSSSFDPNFFFVPFRIFHVFESKTILHKHRIAGLYFSIKFAGIFRIWFMKSSCLLKKK